MPYIALLLVVTGILGRVPTTQVWNVGTRFSNISGCTCSWGIFECLAIPSVSFCSHNFMHFNHEIIVQPPQKRWGFGDSKWWWPWNKVVFVHQVCRNLQGKLIYTASVTDMKANFHSPRPGVYTPTTEYLLGCFGYRFGGWKIFFVWVEEKNLHQATRVAQGDSRRTING